MAKTKYVDPKIPALTTLLGGKGFEAESNVLLTGKPGTGKTTLAWQLVSAFLEEATEGSPKIVQFCAFGFFAKSWG